MSGRKRRKFPAAHRQFPAELVQGIWAQVIEMVHHLTMAIQRAGRIQENTLLNSLPAGKWGKGCRAGSSPSTDNGGRGSGHGSGTGQAQERG